MLVRTGLRVLTCRISTDSNEYIGSHVVMKGFLWIFLLLCFGSASTTDTRRCAFPRKEGDCFDSSEFGKHPNCDAWTTRYTSTPFPAQKKIYFVFSSNETCEQKLFLANIYFNNPCKTDPYHCQVIRKSEVFFENLPAGNHCIKIIPINKKCRDCMCDSRLANVHLSEYKPTTPLPSGGQEKKPLFPWKTVGWGIAVILVVPCLACYLIYRRKIQVSRPAIVVGSVHVQSEQVVITTLSQQILPPRVKIFLIYSRDCAPFLKVIEQFAAVLKDCFGFSVVVDLDIDQQAVRLISPPAWLADNITLDYVDADGVMNKVIIIESEGSVYREDAWLKKRVLPISDDPLDENFINSVSVLTTDLDKVIRDSCYLMVIRFPFTPSSFKLKLTSTNRYVIPDHLSELYVDLTRFHEATFSVPDFFDNHSYLSLLDAVDNMKTFCEENPDHIKDMLVEEKDFHIVF